MLNKPLRPFISLMSRLKYGRKFVLISLLFMIPVFILTLNLFAGQQISIWDTQKKQRGVQQVHELMPFILQVQQHRGLVNGYLNGNVEAKGRIEQKQRETAQLVEEIETRFQAKEFPQSYEKWLSVKAEWEELVHNYENMMASDSFARHSDLVLQVEDLIVLVADESGLWLDSDMDAFHMTQLIIKELPVLIENTAVIRGRGNGVLASGTLSEELRLELMVKAAQSREALANLGRSLLRISELDRDHDEEMLAKGDQAAQQIGNYLALLEQEILLAQRMSMDPDAYFDQGTQAIGTADEVFRLTVTKLDQTLKEYIRELETRRNLTFAITAAVLLLVALFFVAFYKNVMETVNTLKVRAEAMAKGDFTRDVILNTKDELQVVGMAFNEMQRSLNRILGYNQKMAATTFEASRQLTDISHESTAAMQQVATSVQEVSEGTSVQKRTTAEMETAMNEMSTGVQRIAEAASEVANLAMRTSEQAERGNRQLADTVNQFATIKKKQMESSEIVAKLDEYSEQIGQIILTIKEVASQTKMLALNANIEAARAGEHGRGFGVVAQEVGKLAQETSQHGDAISNLLNGIRALIRDAVSAMHSVQTETDLGMDMIEQSRAALEQILEDIRQVSEQIQEVSATSEELSAEMEEVASSISDISHISQKTFTEAEMMASAAEEQLASVEQIESSAEELMGMSRQLMEELGKFKLRDLA